MEFQNIAGFIFRAEAERRLMLEGKVGSFLLRCSEDRLWKQQWAADSKEIMARIG